MKMKNRVGLGNLSISRRRRTAAKEIKAITSVEDKIEDAKRTAALIEEWLSKDGNQVYIGEHGPKQKPKRPYLPARGNTKL